MKRKRTAFTALIERLRDVLPRLLAGAWIVIMSTLAIFALSIWL